METQRRTFVGGLAFGAGLLASKAAFGADGDGHAAGADVASSSSFVKTIPRKTGASQTFSASLDRGPLKATSGGWARDVTSKTLPIATGIAGAHLFMNPGGIREMHWHSSAEWAYVIGGECQATILDPSGGVEVVDYGPGDTWYFPAGHAHAIQAIGTSACHAILCFDDGLYSDHGTFGLSDWLSRLGAPVLKSAIGLPEAAVGALPEAEVYIMQGPVIDRASPAATHEVRVNTQSTHRYRLSEAKPLWSSAGGSLKVAPASAFPISSTMTGFVEVLHAKSLHTPHWHPEANEWLYVVKGSLRATMYEPEKRMATADLKAGDCAYFPRAAGHMLENTGSEPCELVGVHDRGSYQECSLSQWLSAVPKPLLAANLGVPEAALDGLKHGPIVYAAI